MFLMKSIIFLQAKHLQFINDSVIESRFLRDKCNAGHGLQWSCCFVTAFAISASAHCLARHGLRPAEDMAIGESAVK